MDTSCGQYCEKCCGHRICFCCEVDEKCFSIIPHFSIVLDKDMLWINAKYVVMDACGVVQNFSMHVIHSLCVKAKESRWGSVW